MDELPELPFELILSHLNLVDRLKSRAVSRRWYAKINSFKVNNLCCSELPSGFIWGKSRWITSDPRFAENFIGSPRLDLFFNTFSKSILSNLKQLRLLNLEFSTIKRTDFTAALNSFAHLEGLVIRFIKLGEEDDPPIDFELSLPMLNSIHLESLNGIQKLTLDTPRLVQIKCLDCAFMSLEIVHPESVERVIAHNLENIEVKQLKNLEELYNGSYGGIDLTLLSGLEQLKQIHVSKRNKIATIFSEKQQYGLTNLKVYFCGLLLNAPNDPAIDFILDYFVGETFVYLAENPSRLADVIPIYPLPHYSIIESVAPTLATNVLKRLSDCDFVYVDKPVQDSHRFLDFLKNFQISGLHFFCDQPLNLFDRLPEFCKIENLTIQATLTDFQFLSRLKHLLYLHISCSIDTDSVATIFEDLQFLMEFDFHHMSKLVRIERDHRKRFRVFAGEKVESVNDANAAIQFIIEHANDEDVREDEGWL